MNKIAKIKLSKKQWESIGKEAGWMPHLPTPPEGRIFEEVGKHYSSKQIDPTQKEYKYVIEHIPTKKVFLRSIWCWNKNDFLELISKWNNQKLWRAKERV